MKTKIFLILCILSTIAFESSAYKFLIRGGGTRSLFYRIYFDNSRAECTGVGNLSCFLLNSSVTGIERTTWHSFSDIVDFVKAEVKSGRSSGETNYKNDLPLTWKTTADDNIEINVQETAIRGLEKYDSHN